MAANEANPTTSDKIIALPSENQPEPTGSDRNKPTASRTASNPTERFKYRGREWRIFKRKPDPDASWNLYFEANKKRYLFSLGSSSKSHATAEAKLKLDLHFEKREDELRRSMQRPTAGGFATIGDILATVPQLPIDASQESREGYASALVWVLQRALGLTDREQINRLSSSVLTDDTARQYFEGATANAARLDPVKAETYKRTAVSLYDTSRALFAPRALRALRKTFNLKLPDLTDWRAGKLHAPALTSASEFTPPPETIVRKTLTEWIKLARTPGYRVAGGDQYHGNPLSDLDRRNMFIAIGLALSFGFRKGETVRARWNWFDRDEAGPLVRVAGTTQKNKHNVLEVSAVDPFWKVLNFWIDKNGWRGAAEHFCLAERAKVKGDYGRLNFSRGGIHDRIHWPFWLAGKWLRSLGWTTQKTNHALRDLVASKLTMKYGLDAARDWCRHGQQATTEKHYNRFRRRGEQLNANKLAWLRWAK